MSLDSIVSENFLSELASEFRINRGMPKMMLNTEFPCIYNTAFTLYKEITTATLLLGSLLLYPSESDSLLASIFNISKHTFTVEASLYYKVKLNIGQTNTKAVKKYIIFI